MKMMFKLLGKNKHLKNKNKGQRCFILGNGPSLKKQDLEPLGNEVTFVVSAFYNHPIIEKWQPDYYCFADPAFFEDAGDSKGWKGFFNSLRSKIHQSKFIAPVFAEKIIRQNSILPVDRTYFVQFMGELFCTRMYDIDLTQPVPGVWNVIELSIMAAIYMGFDRIYLMGVDHDWLSHRGQDKHFYDGDGGMGKCASAPTDIGVNSYKFWIEYHLKIWNGYERLLKLANHKGVRILNATNGGFLDVFESISYEDIVNKNITKDTKINSERIQQIANGLTKTLELKDKPKATISILQAINRYPDSPELKLIEANLAFTFGDFEEAAYVLIHLAKRWPEYMDEVNNFGIRFLEAGNIDLALQLFNMAIQVNPYHRVTLLSYYKLLLNSGKHDVAADICSTYLCQYPEDDEINMLLQESLKGKVSSKDSTEKSHMQDTGNSSDTRSFPNDVKVKKKHEIECPDGLPKSSTRKLISSRPEMPLVLGKSAINLMNNNEYASALVLIDEAMPKHNEKASKIEGLEYLRSVCFMGMGEHKEAVESAHQDYLNNISNRKNSSELLQALGEDCKLDGRL